MDRAEEIIIAYFKYWFPSLLKEAMENLGRISLPMFRLHFTIFHLFAFYDPVITQIAISPSV